MPETPFAVVSSLIIAFLVKDNMFRVALEVILLRWQSIASELLVDDKYEYDVDDINKEKDPPSSRNWTTKAVVHAVDLDGEINENERELDRRAVRGKK